MGGSRHKITGFSLIEVLMVILLLGVLAAIGVTEFVNFGADSKDAAVKADLAILRRAIGMQNAQMRLRCGVSDASVPSLANLNNNDITFGSAPCTTSQVLLASDRTFVANGTIPPNPWSDSTGNPSTVTACNGGGSCAGLGPNSATDCAGSAWGSAGEYGWCYDALAGDAYAGQIWANSAFNKTTNEHTF